MPRNLFLTVSLLRRRDNIYIHAYVGFCTYGLTQSRSVAPHTPIQIFNLSTYEEKNSFSAHVKQRSFLLGGDTSGVSEVWKLTLFRCPLCYKQIQVRQSTWYRMDSFIHKYTCWQKNCLDTYIYV